MSIIDHVYHLVDPSIEISFKPLPIPPAVKRRALRERAAWCVRQDREANDEWSRIWRGLHFNMAMLHMQAAIDHQLMQAKKLLAKQKEHLDDVLGYCAPRGRWVKVGATMTSLPTEGFEPREPFGIFPVRMIIRTRCRWQWP